MERTKRFKGKKLRLPIIEEEVNKGMFSDQSDVGAEMPNSSDGVHHLRRTGPKEIHLLMHSEIEKAVGGSKVKTHPNKRVEGVKVTVVPHQNVGLLLCRARFNPWPGFIC